LIVTRAVRGTHRALRTEANDPRGVAVETFTPQAFAIWMILLLIVALGAAALTLPRRAAAAEPGSVSEKDRATENDDARRYAAEIVVAADRAAATAARRRAEWEQSNEDVDAAWAAYEAADLAARRSAAASAFPTLSRRRRPGENADRERYLHRAATAACRRHEISIRQLNEVLAHRGWNPRLHPVAQEAALRRAVRDHRLAAYRTATARERQAWQTAELAAVALRSLRAEAQAAQTQTRVLGTDEQWWAEQWDSTVPIRSTVDGRQPVAA
jgi:hypothetical protein